MCFERCVLEHEPEPHLRMPPLGGVVSLAPRCLAAQVPRATIIRSASPLSERVERGGDRGWIRVHHPGLAPARAVGVAGAA